MLAKLVVEKFLLWKSQGKREFYMNKEIFLREMGRLYDKIVGMGIEPEALLLHITESFHFPSESGWLLIEEQLAKMGFKEFERYPQPYGYKIFAFLDDNSPVFELDIHDCAPFKVELVMYGKEPDKYDEDEPACLYRITAKLSPEEMWDQIREWVRKCLAEWERLQRKKAMELAYGKNLA